MMTRPTSFAITGASCSRDIVVKVDGAFGCNQIAAAVSACADGVGYGQFLSYQVLELVREKRLEFVFEDFELEPLPVSLVYPGGRLVSSRLRALINQLKEALRKSDAFN